MIGVLVSGAGTNLQALLDAGLPVVAVASNTAGVRALARAEAARVETAVFELEAYPDRAARDTAMADWFEGRGVRLVVCAGYMQLLTRPFLDRFEGRIVNTHSAKLPDFPGTHPIEDTLAAGVQETAATVHYIDEGVDTGPVIAAEPVPVYADDTVDTLRARVQEVEHRLLPRVVGELSGSRAFLGRRSGCRAGGDSMGNTAPESTVPRAASGGSGAGFRPAGADAGEGRA